MAECLLIRGQNLAAAIDVLPVVAELSDVYGVDLQIDIATPADYGDYLSVSKAVRRVIKIAVPDTTEFTDAGDEIKKIKSDWRSALSSAAKKIGNATSKNARALWQIKEELRLVRYDVVFDFDSNAFSIMLAKAAKTEKIIAFDPSHISNPLPGGHLFNHDTYAFKGDMSNSMRMRRLVGRYFEHELQRGRPSTIRAVDRPTWIEKTPYIALGGRIPQPFIDILEKSDMPVVSPETPLTADDLVGFVQHAAVTVGSGEVTAMAAVNDKKTLYIGNEREMPEGALYITTPQELTAAMQAQASITESPTADNTAAQDSEADSSALETPKPPPANSDVKIKLPGK